MRAVVSIEAKLHKTQDKTGKGIPNSSLPFMTRENSVLDVLLKNQG